MKAIQIKNLFLKFFEKNKYKILNESSLVPKNDNTLLFTNSGMVQFKNFFLGIEESKYKRITTSQTCLRLGGKHNDLEVIGKTPHHNTSFEMLGNFIFNDTSKQEAITLAWIFLTKELKLEETKLHITVHKNDIEALNIWKNLKINKFHIIKGPNETNFWSMGENGPCGYCSEIFYNIEKNGKNLLEIWNLVFIQFNKNKKNLIKLKNISIDTGMGLERIASIKQNVFDNFKTDIYKPLIEITTKILNIKNDNKNENIKIITDHIKTCILLMKNNIMPSNEGQGYILKKLIRRSILKKQDLETTEPLYKLIENFIKLMNQDKSCTENDINIIKKTIKYEEQKFNDTLANGVNILKRTIAKKKNITEKSLFMFYDTHGLPFDIIKNVIKKYDITFCFNNFKKMMEEQKQKNKKNIEPYKEILNKNNIVKTCFTGYKENETETKIIKILKNNKNDTKIKTNEQGIIITEKTSFYPDKGGQIGDMGYIKKNQNIFEVFKTKELNKIYLHYGIMVKGNFNVEENVITQIKTKFRKLTSNNHTATHLLHAALKKILGEHVKQAGSFINHKYLRFDFIHLNHLLDEEIRMIENEVNKHITSNIKVEKFEKNNKKIISIGKKISIEPCAGTHVENTGEIGLFKIIKESGIGVNTRRIEAVTGNKIIDIIEEDNKYIKNITQKLKTNKENLNKTIENLLKNQKILDKENKKLNLSIIENNIKETKNFKIKNNIKIIVLKNKKKYANFISNIIKNMKMSIIILLSTEQIKTYININITRDIREIKAIDLINYLKKNIKIKGGGKIFSSNGVILDNKEITSIPQLIHLYIENVATKLGKKNVDFN